ncbi:MAG: leucine-rich repeat domain-containing protein, partial [Methanobacteriota archaeon]
FEQAAEVFLGSNQLRELSAARIVRSKLTVLDVSDNRLSTLPDDCRLLHALHTLDLRNNDFALLPAWLGFLPVLTRLAVDGNPMRSMRRVVAADSVPSLKAFLKSRASAQETALWEAELAGLALPLPAVAPGSSSTTLSGTVPGNSGGVSSAPALTAAGDVALAVEAEAAVAACWTVVLREGVASGRVNAPSSAFPAPLRSVTLEALAGGRLGMLPRIQALCLDGQAMTSVDALPRDLFMHCPSLHELSMRGIRRLTALPHAVACHADLPLTQQHLRVLLLSDCALTPAALELLPASVSELDVSGNQLRRLPPVLPHLPLLTHLNLARNELRIPDAESEEDDNLWCPRLQVLDLRENALTRLPTSVMALPSLLQLDISYNNLSIIPPHLGMLSTLTALNIEGNPQRSIRAAITDRGAAAVIAYLRSRIPAGDENRFLVMYRDDMKAEEGGEGVDVARMATHFEQLAPFGALPTAVAAPSVYPPAHAATGSGAMLTTPHAAAGGTARSSGPPATAEHYLRMHSQPNLPQREVHSAVAGGEWPPSAPCAASFASVRRGGGAYDCMPPPLPALLPSSAPPMSALAACRADIAALQAEVDGGVGTAPH